MTAPRDSFTRRLFGIGIEDDEELQALQNSPHPKHPKDPAEKLERIMAYMEQMQITTRDNNAILYQMINSMEERINKRIEEVRTEMIVMINARCASVPPPAVAQHPQQPAASAPSPSKTRRASTTEVKGKIDKYNAALIPQPTASSAAAQDVFYDMVDITPQPGFVIKTRKLIGEKNKVFINIFFHELIALTPPGLTSEQATDKPYLMMEAPTCSVDHAGIDCLTFNVGISADYFAQPNPNPELNITAPVTIYKIIHKINLRFNEFLDEGNYSIPRLANGYKGETLPTFRVPKLRATRRDSGTDILATDGGKPNGASAGAGSGSSNGRKVDVAAAEDHNRSTSTMTASPTGGIASIWAATSHLDDHDNGSQHGSNHGKHSPPLHPGTTAHTSTAAGAGTGTNHPATGLTRRGSESNNDTESIVSDITVSSQQAPAQRRSSLSMFLGTGAPQRAGSLGSMDGGAGAQAQHPHLARKLTRKSVLINPAVAGYNGGAIQGRNLLSGDMLDYLPDQNCDNEAAQELKDCSVEDPAILLGWQIWVQEQGENVMYVITDVRKNFLSKTEYRISRYKQDDQWVKLKRQEGKGDVDFRPMRKVLYGLQDDETNA